MNKCLEGQDWSRLTDEMLATIISNAQAEQEKRAKYRQRMRELNEWQEKLDILISDMQDDDFTIECSRTYNHNWYIKVVEA